MSHLQDQATEVLIVGAGPAGLMMACQLALRSIPFRIIDKKENRTNYSGALILQARSVEILQHMGIAQAAIQKGAIAREIFIVFRGNRTFTVPVKNFGEGLTEFPYLLMLEQSKTEQLLTDFISDYGYAVERKTELLCFRQDNEGVVTVLNLPDGDTEIIKVKYLIAADGGNSTVREQLSIPFLGSTHAVSLFVTDCKAKTNLPSDKICFIFSDATSVGFFPLPEGRFRIDGAIPVELKTRKTLEFDDIADNLANRFRIKVKIYKPEWFSVFHSHQRYASSFRQSRCFLTGDAAHIHSPVGAQGMNMGLQDAYNLAWKLALVIQRKAKVTLLNTYSAERRGIARKVIHSSDNVFRFVTSQHFLLKTFRLYVVPLIMKFILQIIKKQEVVRHFIFSAVSEIGIQYRDSPLSHHASLGYFPIHAPKPGDRLPYMVFKQDGIEVNFHEKAKGTGFHLFVFAKGMSFFEIQIVAEKYAHILSIESILFTSETGHLFQRLGIENSGCYLIRPDMYIAYRSVKPEAGHFERYLQQYLIE